MMDQLSAESVIKIQFHFSHFCFLCLLYMFDSEKDLKPPFSNNKILELLKD